MERRIPTKKEVLGYLKDDRNWGRWGNDDQVGAVNMVTDEKTRRRGQVGPEGPGGDVSREFPVTPAANNPTPALHYMRRGTRPNGGGSATDFYGISYHGQATTHLDALCHVWDGNGMWNGRNADDVIEFDGAKWGSVEHLEGRDHHPGSAPGRAPVQRNGLRNPRRTHPRLGARDVAKAEGITLSPGTPSALRRA